MDETRRREPLSVGGWIGTMILLSIPIVNIIMVFVWAFGRGNVSRKNYAIAILVLVLIVIVLYVAFAILFGLSFAGLDYLNSLKDTIPM